MRMTSIDTLSETESVFSLSNSEPGFGNQSQIQGAAHSNGPSLSRRTSTLSGKKKDFIGPREDGHFQVTS